MAPVASTLTRVLITGFGPFGGITNNPSWEIARRLPPSLPNNITLLIHPSYVPVAYHPTINLIPQLISTHQPDIALHMGVAEGRTYFAVEQHAYRTGYEWGTDVDGKVFTEEEQDEVWGGQPDMLSTDLDLQAIVGDWKERTSDFKWPPGFGGKFKKVRRDDGGEDVEVLQGKVGVQLVEDSLKPPSPQPTDEFKTQDVRWSDAVGTYLCGFIYYTDLVEMGERGARKKRDVAFMHVPYLRSEEEIDVGVDVAVELVQALVSTWRGQRGA